MFGSSAEGSRRAVGRRVGAIALWSVAACSAGQGGGNPFDSAGPVTAAPPAMADDDDDGDGSSTGDGTTSGLDDEGAGGGSTDGDPEGSTGAMVPAGSSDGGDPANGMPPAGGMYADCTNTGECGAFPQMCLTIQDENLAPIDGFCTVSCSDPMMDCDPSPVATSMPVCLPTTINGMPGAVCALSCSGGAGCPPGMTCYNFGPSGEACG